MGVDDFKYDTVKKILQNSINNGSLSLEDITSNRYFIVCLGMFNKHLSTVSFIDRESAVEHINQLKKDENVWKIYVERPSVDAVVFLRKEWGWEKKHGLSEGLNGLRKFVQEVLNEYNKRDSFLSNYDSAIKYAYENVDGVSDSFDAYEENPDNIHAEFSRDSYIERIELYVDKYNELKTQNSVAIYRQVNLNTINDLDINNVGMHWSFEKSGVGAYGEQHPNIGMIKTGRPFILEGNVNPMEIDWVYGFNSFIWYGEDQWECALNKGASVTITAINDNKLEQPIMAVVGDH